jgi:hypothetical protein
MICYMCNETATVVTASGTWCSKCYWDNWVILVRRGGELLSKEEELKEMAKGYRGYQGLNRATPK